MSDAALEWLQKNDIPATFENWIGVQFPDGDFSQAGAEMEVPEQFQEQFDAWLETLSDQ